MKSTKLERSRMMGKLSSPVLKSSEEGQPSHLDNMNKSVVRVGDYCVEATPHFCISGSNNVFVNGKPICRKGDNFTEGRVLTEGSKTVFANGYSIGRVGDVVSCGFKVIKGSEDVFAD
ncbi:PAAR family phage protein [Wolbachia endosymbiont of Armadillidium vulgare str. wVulC]|nr:PAAR family phage protein [Wolbachia endosymbiont of Armadillidium vulgare str. wVulC]